MENFAQLMKKTAKQFENEYSQIVTQDTLSAGVVGFVHGIEGMALAFQEVTEYVTLDIVEPLGLFLETFQTTNTELGKAGKRLNAEIDEYSTRLERAKVEYFNASGIADKHDKLVEKVKAQVAKGESKDKLQKMTSRTLDVRGNVDVAAKSYQDAVERMNGLWDGYKQEMVPILENFQQNEESRIIFVRCSLEKYAKQFEMLANRINIQCEGFNNAMNTINSKTDIKLFCDEHQSGKIPFAQVEFICYEDYKLEQQVKQTQQMAKDQEDYIVVNEDSIPVPTTDADKELLQALVDDLFLQEPLMDQKRLVKADQLARSINGSNLLVEVLNRKRTCKCSIVLDNFRILVYLLKNVVSVIQEEVEQDPALFYKLVVILQEFYSNVGGKRQFLYQHLKNNEIWKEQERWVSAIQEAIRIRNEFSQRFGNKKFQKKSSTASNSDSDSEMSTPGTPRGAQSMFKKFFRRIRGGGLGVEEDGSKDQSEKNIVYGLLGQFCYHMTNLELESTLATDIILRFSSAYSLSEDQTCVLLAELRGNEKKYSMDANQSSSRRQSVKRRHKKIGEYDLSILPYVLVGKFLSVEDLSSMRLVNKEFGETFKKIMLKKALFTNMNVSPELRRACWSTCLKQEEIGIDYYAFVEKINNGPGLDGVLNKEIEEIITMDVNRSFNNHQKITPEALQNLLRTYAYFNPEVAYCQGLNYLAGMLYIVYEDEELAFKSLVKLIQNFEMDGIFTSEMRQLKVLFYQLDRLISHILPDLHNHFKSEMISSNHYCSAWFITLFASSFMLNTGEKEFNLLSEKFLLKVWDNFLHGGWSCILKFAILILSIFRDSLLDGSFEEVLSKLNYVQKGLKDVILQEFSDSPDRIPLHKRLKEVHITDDLINTLQYEFNQLRNLAVNNAQGSKVFHL